MRTNHWLMAGGLLSAAVCVLHIAIIFGGAAWYRFFGAGERMARAVESGSFEPAVETIVLAAIFAVWAVYAFSGAGVLRSLPWRTPILATIAAIYLLRGALLVPTLFGITPLRALSTIKPNDAFTVWSSLGAAAIGIVYAVGTWQLHANEGTPQ